jgi:hypothetical protein
MSQLFRRIRTTVSTLPAEDRPGFKRIDVRRARPDAGAWLQRPLG